MLARTTTGRCSYATTIAAGDLVQPVNAGACRFRVWSIVKCYAAAVGVTATPHHFRHLKASTLLHRGASLSEVQDVLGHTSPLTTKQIYAHYAPQVLRRVVLEHSATANDLVAELEAEQERHGGIGAAE